MSADTASPTMGPPPSKRAKKAPTLRAEDWIPHKERIIELHIRQKLPLREVRAIMEHEGFAANERQYRTRISQWKLDRNTKSREMKAVIRKQQHRRLVERDKRPLNFEIRGKRVTDDQIGRWMKRHGDSTVPSSTASTPAELNCWTISDRGSPAPGPSPSLATCSPMLRSVYPIDQNWSNQSPVLFFSETTRFPEITFEEQIPATAIGYIPNSTVTPSLMDRSMMEDPNLNRGTLESLQQDWLISPDNYPLEPIAHIPVPQHITPLTGFHHGHSEVVQPGGRLSQLDIGIQTLRKEHPDTLVAMGNLAVTYRHQGRWKEAEELEVPVFEIRRRTLGKEHPHTLAAMGNLAATYRDQGRWKEAEELEVPVFEIRRRTLGKEHPHTLVAMGSLAWTYGDQGRWKEAEELEVPVFEISMRTLGKEHPHTLVAMGNLAWTYGKQGRWKEAEELGVPVFEIRRRTFGKEHPHTLRSMHSLAIRYSKARRHKEALQLTEQVVALRKTRLGPEHPDTLRSMHNLAIRYSEAGRCEEALQLTERVVALQESKLGAEHPDTLRSMHNLVIRYGEAGRYEEALQLREQVVALRKSKLGAEHPDTLRSIQLYNTISGEISEDS